MKNHKGKRTGSIMQTLLAGFFVPVILIIGRAVSNKALELVTNGNVGVRIEN